MTEREAYNNKSDVLMQARHLCWSISVKSSVLWWLLNAVVKVPSDCWERTLNFRNDTFFSFSSYCSLIPLFLNRNKNDNRLLWHLHIIQKSSLLKTRGLILLFFGTWSVVLYLHVWVKSKDFPIFLVCQFSRRSTFGWKW